MPSIEDEIQQDAPITTESHKNITAKHIPNHLVEDEAKLFENGSELVFAKQENEAVLFQEGSKVQEASICENSIHEQLMELLIESPKIKPEIPSAPAPSMLNGTFEFNLDLPIEEKAADIVFPQSFENSISQAVYKQQQFNSLKPFTAEQLVSFYENPLLLGEEAVVESFLDCRKNLETHPLYENLTYFLRSRLMLKSNLEELEQFNRDVEALTSQLWTTETRRMIEYGECADSKRVKAHYDFPVAHLNEKSSLQLIRQLQQQREKIQEKLVLSVYESHLWRLRVDWLICQGSQHSEHGSISVLFAFLRRPVKDKMFVDHLKFWLNYVAVSLLKRARKEDYIFLAHHAVRCPTGLARWGSPYVQTPFCDPFEDRQGTNIHHVDVGLACFIALSMTNAGHSVPEFCSVGMDLLYILSIADQHRPVVAFLNHLFPLIVTCPDVLYNQPKLLEIFQRLIQADLTYYKRAKNLLAPQFPGVVLKMMASLIENTIWKLNG